jgi:signal transduction histidine kinase
MSHEIRTPLNAVLGMRSCSSRMERRSPSARERAAHHPRGGQPAAGLINDVLDLAQDRGGRRAGPLQPVDLRREIEEHRRAVRAACEEKGLRLRTEIELDGPRPLLVDRAKFGQIVLNLLGNALKFTDQGGITAAGRRVDGRRSSRSRTRARHERGGGARGLHAVPPGQRRASRRAAPGWA